MNCIKKYLFEKSKVVDIQHLKYLIISILLFIFSTLIFRVVRELPISFESVICIMIGSLLLACSVPLLYRVVIERMYFMFWGLKKAGKEGQFKVLDIKINNMQHRLGNLSIVNFTDGGGVTYEKEVLLFQQTSCGLLIYLTFSDNFVIIPKQEF